MNHTLQKYTVGDEDYFILWKDVRLHTYLIANLVALNHLLFQNRL